MEEHRIHGERYEVNAAAWERIHAAPEVLAVGTTTVRVLETLARGEPLAGRTELFITPGFEFRRVDCLLTNFHLPRSTLLALVMAFAGVEETRRLYELAIEERYRFYSFGDAMLDPLSLWTIWCIRLTPSFGERVKLGGNVWLPTGKAARSWDVSV